MLNQFDHSIVGSAGDSNLGLIDKTVGKTINNIEDFKKEFKEHSNFSGYTFSGVDFRNFMIGKYQQRCNFQNTTFINCIYNIGTTLFDCDFRKSCFESEDLTKVIIHNCNFSLANLKNIKLEHAFIRACEFKSACLVGAFLRYTEFKSCILDYANLSGANTDCVSFFMSVFYFANLSGCDLTACDILYSNFQNIIVNKYTIFYKNYYNKFTKFNDDFNSEDFKMIFQKVE